MKLRRAFWWVHLIGGLAGALLLLLLGVTGAFLVFEGEVDAWLNTKLKVVAPERLALPLAQITKRLEADHPGSKVVGFSLPQRDDRALGVNLAGKGGAFSLSVNPYTGETLGNLATANKFCGQVHQFHTRLLLAQTGQWITGVGAIILIVLAISGMVLWWPFQVFRVRLSKSGRRVNWDLHAALGFYSSLFMLLFGITGAVIHWEEPARDGVNWLTGQNIMEVPKAGAPTAGAVALDGDAVRASAVAAAPGAHVTIIAGLGKSPVRVIMKYPEDGTPAGRTNLYMDAFTGKVLAIEDSRTAAWGTRVVKLWNREIHTGDLFGWPSRILASLMSLALPLLAITGPLIWWGKWRRKGAA